MNLGIDFGSTYTVLSVYNQASNLVDAMIVDDSPNIPSVAALKHSKLGETWSFGKLAKKNTGKPNTDIFKAFKMLLPEKDQKLVESRGFTGENTPYAVTSRFLEYCFHMALDSYQQQKVENLVICAPEIWSAAINTADGRPILRDICAAFPFVGSMQVVSEPAAASAFFAHNYEVNMGSRYNGHILLIDYGGGTLDITLTKVYSRGDGRVEIKVLKRTGAGENEDGMIGKAGVAYMEDVIRKAAEKMGLSTENDGHFLRAVDDLEAELRGRVNDIKGIFDMYGLDDSELDEEIFADDIEYGMEVLQISFGDLLRSYRSVIEPVLREKIQEIISFMDSNGINYKDIKSENFKIACVGGFGTFYLVENQINSIFKFSAMDKRRKGIITAAQERERAISYGAALIAAGVVSIKSTAPYSVGIYAKSGDGKVCTNFAIQLRSEIDYNQPYYQCDSEGRAMTFFVPNGGISSLIINTGTDKRGIIRAPIKENFKKKLENLVTGPYKIAHVGFSLDQSEVLSIHIQECDYSQNKVGPEKKVELSRFNDLLETSIVVPLVDF